MSAARRRGRAGGTGSDGGAASNGAGRGGARGNGTGADGADHADDTEEIDDVDTGSGGADLEEGASAEEILEDDFEAELELAAEAEGISMGNGAVAKRPNALMRLYRGETSFDFIGNRRWWFGISSIIILISIISLSTRGLNPSIDFKGGQSWLVTSQTLTVPQATAAAQSAGVASPTVVQLTNQITHQKQIQVTADLNLKSTTAQDTAENNVTNALAAAAHTSPNNVNLSEVGKSWGSNVTKKAIEALIVFFILVSIYISIRFEFKMAVAAIVAVIHDVVVTAGVYSLTGFQVTPDTVVAVLTVLGYSLYDTVVVFDRIRDNSKGLGASGRITYSEMVNLSMNQTLARSINTSLVAIMPVLSVLVIGSFILGDTSLQAFGLALVIGLTSGAYSSIFIASPLLAFMKEREPRYVTIRQRIESRGERYGTLTPLAAAAMAGGGSPPGRSERARATTTGVIRPGAANRRRTPSGKSQQAGRSATNADAPSTPSGSPKSGSGSARGASGSTRPGARRPPPRPRKGKGGSKGKRRR
jgi:preprotein translocase subunit SecF